jgi:peptidoglycan/LPS O-acetylase OafA/YrhL
MTDRAVVDAATPPVGIRRSTTYLPALESQRGLAIALVYAYHVDGSLTTDFVPNGSGYPFDEPRG